MYVSRRKLLGLAAGAAAASLVRRPLTWADEANHTYGGYALGMQTYTYRNFPTVEALKTIHELGLTRVEFGLRHLPVITDNATLAVLNKDSAKNKLAISRMGVIEFENQSPPAKSAKDRWFAPLEATNRLLKEYQLKISGYGVVEFGSKHDENAHWFSFAKEANIPILPAYPTYDAMDSLEKLVKEYDIKIAIHNHGPNTLYPTPAEVLKAVEGRDPRVGACADLGHYIRAGQDPVKVVTVLGDRLLAVHLKDYATMEDKARDAIIGEGHLDLEGVFKVMKKNGFSKEGSISLEYEANPENPTPDIKKCLVNINAAMTKVFG